MPKKNKKKKSSGTQSLARPMIYASEEGQVYGWVMKALGSCFFAVYCSDGKQRRCKVRSKRLRIVIGHVIIVGLRDFDEVNGDILYKYIPDEVRRLVKEKHLPYMDPENKDVNVVDGEYDDDDGGFDFEEI
jgi:initiation factor 1A